MLASTTLSASAFSEVTTGSLWQLQFNNLNVNVAAGTTKTLSIWAQMNPVAAAGFTLKGTGTASTYDKVAAGISRIFTITGTIPDGVGGAGFTGLVMGSINWNDTDNSAATNTVQNWGISDFKTAEVYVTA